MKVYSLMYHDVVKRNSDSGFLSPLADNYKVCSDLFISHLSAIKQARQDRPVLIDTYIAEPGREPAFLLTFDDGGESAYPCIVDILDEFGWKAHFFISTDYINSSGFLTVEQIRRIRKRGHIIGTHTCSHPDRITSFNFSRIINEWSVSVKILSDIIGEPVKIGSVPYGQVNKNVIKAAAMSGIKVLFVSTPIIGINNYFGGNCKTIGRFIITKKMCPRTVVGLLSGALIPRFQQVFSWSLKKILRLLFGSYHSKLRDFYFSLRDNHSAEGA